MTVSKKMYHIEPIYKSFIWAGKKLIEHFKIDTSLPSIGTIYHVIAIPNDLDNVVIETQQKLSEFYVSHKSLFGITSDSDHFPIRMTTTANEGFQSYQVHPDDAYALKKEGLHGKVSGAVALFDTGVTKKSLFGTKAKNREEFKRLILNKDWDNLFSTIEITGGDFLHTPAGVIHGGYGDGKISATFGTNSDITYRLYDLDRNDPNRPLHLEQVFECSMVPTIGLGPKHVEPKQEKNIEVYNYHDKEKEYTAKRIKTTGSCTYSYSGFMFMTCVNGQGNINGEPISLGETIFVPADYGELSLEGNIDLIVISYREQ